MGRKEGEAGNPAQEDDSAEKRPDPVGESDEESFPASDPPESYQVD